MSIARLMQMAAARGGYVWADPDLANASYDSVSFDVSGQAPGPTEVVFSANGSKLYIIGNVTDSVYQYSLSTPFDLSTASYDSVSFSVGSQMGNPYGLFFSPDGTKMFALDISTDAVYQYSLSTGFDLSTASYDSVSFSAASQDTNTIGLSFNPEGTKMFVLGITGDAVYQYSLSTGFNLSTASYDSVSFSVASQDTVPSSIRFNPDGTRLFVLGVVTDAVYQYSLSTGFNLSTASYDSVSFSVASQEATPYGFDFSSDGSKMYVVGFDNDTIYQYSTD